MRTLRDLAGRTGISTYALWAGAVGAPVPCSVSSSGAARFVAERFGRGYGKTIHSSPCDRGRARTLGMTCSVLTLGASVAAGGGAKC